VKRVARRAASAAHRSRSAAAKPVSSETKAVEDPNASKYASPWKSTGVSGRMVRVGAYSSLEKGKDAWSRLAELSPAIKQLPAVVTDLQTPSGRTLYWLQIGTTSQAHSEVLCQRMRAMKQSCVVVDVAGARKGSKNERQPVGI
jgi:SPOR domain